MQRIMQRQRESMENCLRYPGKVVIVTGGTSGNGLAIVREFVRQGANVAFCSRARGAEMGQRIQRELQHSGYPGDAYYQVCDVRNEDDIKRLILVTVERYGRLDCLVNNVGDGPIETIDDVSAEDFRSVMELNLVSCFLTSKYALPHLRRTRGNIINMGSLVGIIGTADYVSYVTSKGGLIAMTKALAIDESKHRVRVNSLSPVNIWTPLWERHVSQSPDPETEIQNGKDAQLMGRFGTPEEVASAVLFLAADGTFCTGTNLVLSGGAELGFGKKNQVESESEPSESGHSQDFSSKHPSYKKTWE